jgi:XRE family aerobic/anaerobic benzoate catabolism transcriptional regulator
MTGNIVPHTMDLLGTLGSRVREARIARGWTIKELAAAAGLSVRFVGDVESGRGNISVLKLAGLAKALGLPIGSLLDDGAAPARPVISLVGLRGAGKSTIGKKLAGRLGVPFLELDAMIEAAAGISLAELFAIHGETYYRKLETTTLGGFLEQGKPAVLATGGGIVTNPDAWDLLRRESRVVWLRATPEDHWERVVKQGDRRPMGGSPRAKAELRSILRAREPLYRQAHVIADTSTLGVAGAVESLTNDLA